MFARLGSWCVRRRKSVVIAWVVGVMFIGFVSSAVGTTYEQDFSLEGFESTDGLENLEEHFGGFGGGVPGSIVFESDAGADDPEVKARMEQLFTTFRALAEPGEPDLDGDERFDWLTDEQRDEMAAGELELFDGMILASPYEPEGAAQISEDRTIAFANMELPGEDWMDAMEVGSVLKEILPEGDGLRIEIGGMAYAEFEEPSTEALGIAFAIVILVVAFGSVLAMGLPIGVALAGIAAGSMVVGLLSNLIEMPDFATFLGIMIGLGVGIDYALFIVTRYRENLHHGHTIEESVSIAIDTAGRAVAFAGLTVVVSFLGMMVMGVAFISGLAVSAAGIVLMTVAASLTLLPALLGFAGQNIERTKWRGVVATGFAALGLIGFGLKLPALSGVGFLLAVVTLLLGFVLKPLQQELVRKEPKPIRQTGWFRWSRFIQHHPWTAALAGAAILIVLALPTLGIRLGFSDEGNYDESTTTRQAYDLIAEGFGPGFAGPFVLTVEVDDAVDQSVLDDITAAVAADRGVAMVAPPVSDAMLRQFRGQDPGEVGAYLWQVTPTSSPEDEATYQLVDRLRDEVLAPGEAALGTNIDVTGAVAGNVDFSNLLAKRMPYFFAAVLVLSFVLMMAVFRSVLVPLKAVIMNLLSIAAAYGITVALVQWAWFSDLTGLQSGPIESFAPMMFFAIVFGLSMDYEVFLLSRVKEEWHRTGDSHISVANGLAATARVITAAAAIMVFVFGAFLLENDRTFKLFGVGLASAIFLDATVVRMLLVPATMELLGDRNWWLPKWLDRILPNIDVEGTPDTISDFDDEDESGKEPEKELTPV
ncbi:MAG: MMPL family transporter [Actinomycetota bacterium]|nr:MMPL family transporter [Actinomycetota bacterium]